ncbi:hypothetical protein TNCV_570031 [Trichonephila clavipes]|nr:hypothetical protein TNCV_570031 [Trichonephila clavipes]
MHSRLDNAGHEITTTRLPQPHEFVKVKYKENFIPLMSPFFGNGQIEAHEIHHGKGLICTPVAIRDNTIWLDCTPILMENTLEGGSGASNHPHDRTCGSTTI